MKHLFLIKGMKCAACQAHVTRAVTALPFVKSVEVNLLTGLMTVEYDDAPDTEKNVIDTVVKSGFKAQVIEDDQPYQLPPDESGKLLGRFLLSFVLLAGLVAVRLFVPTSPILPSLLQFVIAGLIIFVNRDYFTGGFARLIRFSPDMNSLIAIGSGSAMLYSVVQLARILLTTIAGDTEFALKTAKLLYFDSAAMILVLVTFGKFLEAKAKYRTTGAIAKLIRLVPRTAILIRNGKEAEIPAAALMPGDTVLIRPGASIPADGVITEGTGLLDESAITGESVPVGREVGEHVTSGTINRTGSFRFRVERAGRESVLSRMIQLVESASNSKAPVSRFADRVSLFFVPAVILLAVAAGVIWFTHGESVPFCLSMMISVLVVSCPCALGLATPVAIMVATGVGSRHGILFRNAAALEELSKIRTIVLDKTGTVTAGRHQVVHVRRMNAMPDEQYMQVLARTAALESRSEHPFARALTLYMNCLQIPFDKVVIQNFTSLPGFGVTGAADGQSLVCGNVRMMEKSGVSCEIFRKDEVPAEFRNCSAMYVADAETKKLLVVFLLADVIREDAVKAAELFRKLKHELVLLTGDTKASADVAAASLGISKVYAEMTPDAKAEFIHSLRADSKHGVAMVGDGINDAAALSVANVGIAIGSGTDIAVETADVVLAKNSLVDAVSAIQLSRATMRTIRLNLFWAFFYNVLCIPIAGGALYPAYGLKLHPAICVIAMACSSIFVVMNALRLHKFQPEK